MNDLGKSSADLTHIRDVPDKRRCFLQNPPPTTSTFVLYNGSQLLALQPCLTAVWRFCRRPSEESSYSVKTMSSDSHFHGRGDAGPESCRRGASTTSRRNVRIFEL
ncbi:hypothetical protein AGIG_G22408 [Arapaima gigas]